MKELTAAGRLSWAVEGAAAVAVADFVGGRQLAQHSFGISLRRTCSVCKKRKKKSGKKMRPLKVPSCPVPRELRTHGKSA